MKRSSLIVSFLIFSLIYPLSVFSSDTGPGLNTVSAHHWNDKAVRKILYAFAYGGSATDEQIHIWAHMLPEVAIQEMLTFDSVNEKLSPIEDGASLNASSLQSLQGFWSDASNPENPVYAKFAGQYSFLQENKNDLGTFRVSAGNLGKAWVQSATTKGLNPFLSKVGLYLTNYHMALRYSTAGTALLRDFYDDTIATLQSNGNMIDVLAQGATSAAVARAYGHHNSRFHNRHNEFHGNDDFAREFNQLFFKILGNTEFEPLYHEDVTIEHTAWALSGMRVDRRENAYGSNNKNDWFVSPIVYDDDWDGYSFYIKKSTGEKINLTRGNLTYHFGSDPLASNFGECLEILREQVCGANAGEVITNLTQVAGNHEESLSNMPVFIAGFFADDNLYVEPDDISAEADVIRDKISRLQYAWSNQSDDKNLLTFLQTYAISKIFHSPNRVKYASSFDRHLTLWNQNSLSNEESSVRNLSPSLYYRMSNEGAQVFFPVHNVFGAQTSKEASNDAGVFWQAYNNAVSQFYFIGASAKAYPDDSGDIWQKDWASVIPANTNGDYIVHSITEWLWNRFVADGGKNLDPIARAQVQSILATGNDLGYALSQEFPGDAEYPVSRAYTSADILSLPVSDINHKYADTLMAFNSVDPNLIKQANDRIGMAVMFITMTPYMFAQEGE